MKVVASVLLIGAVGLSFFGYQLYTDRVTPTVDFPIEYYDNDAGEIVIEEFLTDTGQLWGLDFIPETALLIATERQGKLFIINTESQEASEISGVPAVSVQGQGGLLDIAVSPDFLTDQTIFLTYSASGTGGSATHVARATLDVEESLLTDVEVLYQAPFQNGGSHFGSRVAIQNDYIFITLGDRADKNFANHISQNTRNPYGSIIRLHRDGSVPDDNPFVGDNGVLDEIYSYGHRNPQGLTVNPDTNELWSSEHGEFQGDEINIIIAGGNYGWPEAHTACSYVTRRPFGVLPEERPDTVAPVFSWSCGESGFPPAGMVFYDGDMFSSWKSDLFVAGLAQRSLAHFKVTNEGLVPQVPLLVAEGWRVRDVVVSPTDGALYVAVEGTAVSLVRIVKVPVN